LKSAAGDPADRWAKVIFSVAALIGLIYGVILLLVPQLLPGLPANPGWVRWSGGFLIGTATAIYRAAHRPRRHRTLAFGLTIAYALSALALLYSVFSGELQGARWFIWPTILLNATLAVAMGWIAKNRGV
jgi:hypothetical protein